MNKHLLAATACIPALLTAAAAQDTAPADTIVVTAQKREQNIQDVGATISALGSQMLEESRIVSMRDIAGYVPNIDIREQAPGTLPVITIRGVGLNDFSNTNNPSAGVYIDEVYLSSLGLLSFDFFDLERIEVLKGPQGTLYGRNSTAGAVNFITAKPSFDGPMARLSMTYGNFSTLEAEGVANLPVSDDLAIRLGAKAIRQWEGYYFNRTTNDDIGERNIALGRAQIRWQPDNGADVLLKVEGFSNNSGLGQGAFFGAVDYTNPPTFACAAIAQNETDPSCTNYFGYGDSDGDPFTGDWSTRQFYDAKQIGATLRAVFDLGGAELTSVTGFIDHYREAYNDLDASPATALEFIPTTDVRQYSQELRLAGDIDDRLTWLLGAFWSHDHIIVGSTGYADALFRTQTSGYGDQTTDSVAGFAHGEYTLTDTLTLIGGLRVTWEEKEYTARVFDDNPFGTSCLISATCTPGPTPQVTLAAVDGIKTEDTNLSWKAGLDWKPSPSTLLYVSASRGVKSGGFFFGFTTNSGSFQPFEPESLISYEAGVKHQTADGALRLAASGFYYDYSDIQTFIRDQASVVPFQRLGNVDSAELYGIDFEATLAPPAIEGLTLTVGVGYLESELGSFVALSGPVAKGNEFPNAPKVSFNTVARYERPIGAGLLGAIQVDGRYSGSTFKDALNDPLIAADSFTLWNGRLSISSEDGRWEAAVWAKNIFDEAYKVQGVNLTGLGFGYENYNAPRTFGGTIGVQF